jgi:excinuclease ABC subunit C
VIAASIKNRLKQIPPQPGVYLFKAEGNEILYVGKARNLRHRVPSYFLRAQPDRGPRIAHLVDRIKTIDWFVAESEIEALILEANLIGRLKPRYNVEWKDDKSYLHVAIKIQDVDWPQIRFVRAAEVGKDRKSHYFGPYTSPGSLKRAVRFIRKIFPFCEYSFKESSTKKGFKPDRPCLYYHLGLCPGPCAGAIELTEYKKRIRHLVLFLQGKKRAVIKELLREMKRASREKRYEEAAKLRDQLVDLEHLRDISLLRAFEEKAMPQLGGVPHRIEAYDVSNILGNFAVGAMVVFRDGEPDKNEYRKFKIKTVPGISDVGSLLEILRRRLSHSRPEFTQERRKGEGQSGFELWPLPNLIVIDGGKAQLNAAVKALTEYGLQTPVLAVAKGPSRKKADEYWYGPRVLRNENLLRRVRDEAHRFAINYHRSLHRKSLVES